MEDWKGGELVCPSFSASLSSHECLPSPPPRCFILQACSRLLAMVRVQFETKVDAVLEGSTLPLTLSAFAPLHTQLAALWTSGAVEASRITPEGTRLAEKEALAWLAVKLDAFRARNVQAIKTALTNSVTSAVEQLATELATESLPTSPSVGTSRKDTLTQQWKSAQSALLEVNETVAGEVSAIGLWCCSLTFHPPPPFCPLTDHRPTGALA